MSRYIDADELLELYDIDLNGLETDKPWTIPLEVVKQNIKDMPTADVVKVRYAKWQHYDYGDRDFYKDVYQCSECRFLVTGTSKMAYAYCPNCGARMDRKE